jgi:DNA-binding MarR family transcriptional regulator
MVIKTEHSQTARLSSSAGLDEAISVLEAFRHLRPHLPIQTAMVFLLVARRGIMKQSDLQELTGLSQAAVTRNVQALSQVDFRGKPGLDLIRRQIDLYESRSRVLTLTPKGKALAAELARPTS